MIFDMVDTRVVNHFNLPGHSLEEFFLIIPIEQPQIVGSQTDLLRLEREAFWIVNYKQKSHLELTWN